MMVNSLNNKKIIAITGPTASGKSNLAYSIADYIPSEIVSCDAFQVYVELNSGVNKPTLFELEKYVHYFVSSKSIYEKWDVAVFQNECAAIVKDIWNKGKIPILVGGSNLYLDAFLKNYDFKQKNIAQVNIDDHNLYNELCKIDLIEANKIGENNFRRLRRAIEIYYETGLTKSTKDRNESFVYQTLLIVNSIDDRQELYKKINSRVDLMLNSGWKDEIKNLMANNPKFVTTTSSRAHGYPEIIDAILRNKEIDVDKIKQNTRRYAKRQLTWCRRKYSNAIYFDPTQDDFDSLLVKVKEFTNE